MRTTDSGNCIDVNNFQCWICRRLRPNHLRLARLRGALERWINHTELLVKSAKEHGHDIESFASNLKRR